MLTGTLIGRRPASQVIVSRSAEPGIPGQFSTPVYTANGLFLTQGGQPRFYYATDNLVSPHHRRLTPPDLVDLAIEHNLHFDPVTQQGVTFNLIGAVSQFGKLGIVSIAASPEGAEALYGRTVRVLDAAC